MPESHQSCTRYEAHNGALYFRGVTEPADETERRFAENFRSARDAAGLSGRQVADQMRQRGFPFHQQTVVRIESGEQRVRIGEGTALAHIVGSTLDALTRPPELALLAADIMTAARKVREQKRELASLTRRHEVDVGNLRRFLAKAQESGAADKLRGEIRAGMSALGDPVPREGTQGSPGWPQSGQGTAGNAT
jgi:transcriptional regulator with XRE-family HTH domain